MNAAEKSRLNVRPRQGLTVRDPDAGYAPLAESGAQVSNTSYWRRRLAVGDVAHVGAKRRPAQAKSEE